MQITAGILLSTALGVAFLYQTSLHAQAPPGPIIPPASAQLPPPPPPKPKAPAIEPRTDIGGDWNLNSDQSDDPRSRLDNSRRSAGNGGNYPGGSPGGGYPGGGNPGGYPGGFPFPGGGGGGNGPYGGRRGDNNEDTLRLLEFVQPAQSLSVALKDPEVDVTTAQNHLLVFYTDGRKLPKSSDQSREEFAAHWAGHQLIADEKSPPGGPPGLKLGYTFELSGDGRQLYEIIHIDESRSRGLPDLRYVYDIGGNGPAARNPDSDPDRPILKRVPSAGADSNPAQ